MPGYVIRIWLPDRPGALGLVASRIGSVGGDIVSIDILGRDGGQAVDEFVVELATAELVELLRSEIHEVDGVEVESVRLLDREVSAVEE
jgi:ACT domain-containing protein